MIASEELESRSREARAGEPGQDAERPPGIEWAGCPALPDRPEAERLLGELAFLIDAGGHERFTVRRVVAPTPRDFPEPWVPVANGVRHLLRRLFAHADLDLAVHLEDLRRGPSSGGLASTEIFFSGINDDGATFELHTLGNDDVLGILSHVTGAAYAAAVRPPDHPFRGGVLLGERGPSDEGEPEGERAGAGTGERDEDAWRGSIAAVYLGLGVLAANASQYQRTWSTWNGRYASHETQIATAGGLTSESLSFLLAVQATVRGEEIPAHGALLPNQAADTAAWREALAGQGDALRRRLGVPPPAAWSVASATDSPDGDGTDGDDREERAMALTLAAAQDLALFGDPEAAVAEDLRRLRRVNVGRRVYRVRHDRAHSRGLLLSIPALVAGLIASGGGVWIAATASVGALAVGIAWGRRSLWWECSDARCRSHLKATDSECPICGGTIAAEIQNADQRLELDEQFEQAEAAARASRRLEAGVRTSERGPR